MYLTLYILKNIRLLTAVIFTDAIAVYDSIIWYGFQFYYALYPNASETHKTNLKV